MTRDLLRQRSCAVWPDCGYYFGDFWKKLDYFIIQHLVTLILDSKQNLNNMLKCLFVKNNLQLSKRQKYIPRGRWLPWIDFNSYAMVSFYVIGIAHTKLHIALIGTWEAKNKLLQLSRKMTKNWLDLKRTITNGNNYN